MTAADKPYEFWLYDNGEIPFLAFYTEKELTEDTHGRQIDKYHVIEYQAYSELQQENARLKAALNKIAMAGSSGMAYTKEFTELANQTARRALEEYENANG